MICKRKPFLPAAMLMLAIAAVPLSAIGDDKAPMPDTKGMKGMDPALHDKWAKEGKQDPNKDCTPNAEKVAVMKEHPMPDTKGMKGMDPKAHEMDCPEPEITKPDPNKPQHIHKAPGGG
jgi:hypothetical protein